MFVFFIYFGTIGTGYTWMNEVGEPFNVGVGIASSWMTESLYCLVLPYIFNN